MSIFLKDCVSRSVGHIPRANLFKTLWDSVTFPRRDGENCHSTLCEPCVGTAWPRYGASGHWQSFGSFLQQSLKPHTADLQQLMICIYGSHVVRDKETARLHCFHSPSVFIWNLADETLSAAVLERSWCLPSQTARFLTKLFMEKLFRSLNKTSVLDLTTVSGWFISLTKSASQATKKRMPVSLPPNLTSLISQEIVLWIFCGFLFVSFWFHFWTISTTLKHREAIRSADVAKGEKETITAGNWRGRKIVVALDKGKAVSQGQHLRVKDMKKWRCCRLTSWESPWDEGWKWFI